MWPYRMDLRCDPTSVCKCHLLFVSNLVLLVQVPADKQVVLLHHNWVLDIQAQEQVLDQDHNWVRGQVLELVLV